MAQLFVFLELSGKTDIELATKAGVHATLLSKWRNHRDSGNLDLVCRCYKALGFELVPLPINGDDNV